MAAQKSALILLPPEDAEEIEVIVTGDVLVRGGLQVLYAGSSTEPVKCAKGARIVPDVALKDVKNKTFDIIIIPGGPGCSKLAECPVIGELLKTQVKSGGLIGAICAGPTVLLAHGIVAERVTCHYTVKDKMTEGGYKYLDDNVVISDRVITSKGPGTAFEFALKIVETLEGPEKTSSLLKPLCLAK